MSAVGSPVESPVELSVASPLVPFFQYDTITTSPGSAQITLVAAGSGMVQGPAISTGAASASLTGSGTGATA